MVGGEVQLGIHVQVVLHLGAVGNVEAHAREDVDDFVLDDGQGVACAQRGGVGGACQVQVVATRVLAFELLLQGVDFLLCLVLELVQLHAHFLFLVGGHASEVGHQFVDGTLLAEVFDAECLQFFGVGGRQCFHFLQKLVDFSYHIVVVFLIFRLLS